MLSHVKYIAYKFHCPWGWNNSM